jgi:hypothetical protein
VSDRVGIEITGTRVYAVTLAAWGDRPRALAEGDWDPAHPAAAVAMLAGRLGRVGRIGLAVGLDWLHVKHVDLPPGPAAVRRKMVAVEPDRFFPVQDDRVVVGLVGDIAFAVEQSMLERWVAALETWAPVESVEASPVAMARVLAPAGDGGYAFALGDGAAGIIDVRGGVLASARHATGPAAEQARANARLVTPVRDVPANTLAAWGAARGLDGDLEAMMLGDEQRSTVARRRARRLAGAAVACVIALGFALWALGRSRDDALARLARE